MDTRNPNSPPPFSFPVYPSGRALFKEVRVPLISLSYSTSTTHQRRLSSSTESEGLQALLGLSHNCYTILETPGVIAWCYQTALLAPQAGLWSRSSFFKLLESEKGVVFLKLLESETVFQNCWSRNPEKSSDSITLPSGPPSRPHTVIPLYLERPAN